ncbi:MAG TPA: FAD-dependent oxidoreductase [Candidatus Magasanikbacteria bacterium]|nr:FAD-dependent oxidoreductase [Candidatus Magasanikbacteria bacterium]
MSKQNELLDLVIIGAAAAGCAAAVYAARRNLKFAMVTKDIGGEVALSGEVENWPGIIHTTGFELAQQFYKHAESYGIKADAGYAVTGIEKEGAYFIVKTEDYSKKEKIYYTKTVIIGSGIHPRELGIPGEKELRGKGVTYCTVCDGPLYRGKITTTIGAGNAALESALMMAELAQKVYFITKFPNTKETNGGFPKGENILIDKVKKAKNVEIIYAAKTGEILGADTVTGVSYIDATGTKQTLETNGVMVHIGNIPNSDFATIVDRTPLGEIKVDLKCATSIPGIFAAGDVTTVPYKQIVIAAGQGVTAALSAIEYINKLAD